MSRPKRLLFVCYANVIRSPAAEGVFARLVAEAGQADQFEADSAGTGVVWGGEPPHPLMVRLAAERGIDLQGASRRFQRTDFERFDWILAADSEVKADLTAMAASPRTSAKVRLLRSFDPQAESGTEIPDPVGLGAEAFAETFAIIERSVRGLIEALGAGAL